MFVNRNYVYWAKVTQQLTISRRYFQLVANRCCRLTCSLLETPFVTRDVLFFRKICSWTDLFVMRGVREPRFHCLFLHILYLSEVKWSGVRWSVGDKFPCTLGWLYAEGTWVYCDYYIWCVLVSCTVVVLTYFKCVGVCKCGLCWQLCGCFGNMCTCIYSVLYCLFYVYVCLFVFSVLV
jgi:hypothetical protein